MDDNDFSNTELRRDHSTLQLDVLCQLSTRVTQLIKSITGRVCEWTDIRLCLSLYMLITVYTYQCLYLSLFMLITVYAYHCLLLSLSILNTVHTYHCLCLSLSMFITVGEGWRQNYSTASDIKIFANIFQW